MFKKLFFLTALIVSNQVCAKDYTDAVIGGVKVKSEQIESIRMESTAILTKKGEKSKKLRIVCDQGQGEVSKIYVGTNCQIFLPNGESILVDIKK